MDELIEGALDAAVRGGAQYADVRVVERENVSLTVKNGVVEGAGANRRGGWGCARCGMGVGLRGERVDGARGDRAQSRRRWRSRAQSMAQRDRSW